MSPYIAIVQAKFNPLITNHLLEGALGELNQQGFSEDQIEVIKVPGAFEIPGTVSALLRHRQFKAIICIGAVIRGETSHYDFVAGECARGIAELSQKSPIPIIFGVLTTENSEQALARCGIKGPNHGSLAAKAAIDMIGVLQQIKTPKSKKRGRSIGASIDSNT